MKTAALTAGLLLLAAAPAAAHHSFAADFDATRPLQLTGRLSKIEWTNPHAHINLDVMEPGAPIKTWKIELATPNVLMRGGWRRDSVAIGDRLIVKGYAARNGSLFANARSVTTASGHLLFSR